MTFAIFEIGYIPEGWTKGAALRMVPTRAEEPERKGCILLEPDSLRAIMKEGFDPRTGIIVLWFHHNHSEQVKAWLEWWKN